MDLTEAQTRKQLIDKQLKTAGWLKKYIKEEVKYDPPNTIKKKILELEENISKPLRELEF